MSSNSNACAVGGTFNPAGSSVIMAPTLDQGVHINPILSVSKLATRRKDEHVIMQADHIYDIFFEFCFWTLPELIII